MYAGFESEGGPCEWRIWLVSNTEAGSVGVLAGCVAAGAACDCGEMRPLLDGVVPFCEQFSEQQRRATVTCGLFFLLRAALQQSIAPIAPIAPPMLHDCSLECIGIPASALPPSTSKRIRDAIRVLMIIDYCIERANGCQESNSSPGCSSAS